MKTILAVFYYLSVFEIWPDKWSGLIKRGLLYKHRNWLRRITWRNELHDTLAVTE